MGTESSLSAEGLPAVSINHPIYWFDDGTLVLDVEQQRFKIHRTLLTRHSRSLAQLVASPGAPELNTTNVADPSGVVVIRPKATIRREDIEVLLEHLYHDLPMTERSSFSRVVSILRISSPEQLDFPALHSKAKEILEGKFSTNDPTPFDHEHPLSEALDVASQYAIYAARKAILYTIVTTTEFNVDAEADALLDDVNSTQDPVTTEKADEATPVKLTLSKSDAETCMALMTKIIDHFTPILFTVPPAGHMACTDLLAEDWMSLVIQPAIADDGVYKPIETLERIKNIDWGSKGICDICVQAKRDEWTEEQRTIWKLMDNWLN